MSLDAVLIAGPTASGKSAAALELAERLNGVVVNADSMQVYAELRVLTARPNPQDEARASHCLYGHVPVRERYSVGRYQDDAVRALGRARASGRLPIFAGGTGLYFSTLTMGLSPIPPVPARVREDMRRHMAALGPEAFYAAFAARDPEMAARLRSSDVQRVLRAAEVLETTGRSLRAWQQNKGVPVLDGYRIARFVLAPPREGLRERIDARFRAMIAGGAVEEARALADLDPSLPAARALGVPALLRHVRGEIGLEAAIAAGQAETRRYAKRQMTWFRRSMSDWKWLETEGSSNIVTKMLSKIV